MVKNEIQLGAAAITQFAGLVAQLVRASDRNSEDPGSNPGWISMSFFAM